MTWAKRVAQRRKGTSVIVNLLLLHPIKWSDEWKPELLLAEADLPIARGSWEGGGD